MKAPAYELTFVIYTNDKRRKDGCWWWVLNRASTGTLPPECLAHSAGNFPTEEAARADVDKILLGVPNATIKGSEA